MTTKCISGLDVANGLATITRNQDRSILEKTLIKAIHELYPDNHQYLFSIFIENGSLQLTLKAESEQGSLAAMQPKIAAQNLDITQLNFMCDTTINTGNIESFPVKNKSQWHILYPIFDEHHKVFNILLSISNEPNINEQQTIKGILCVYSNYLSVINRAEHDKLTGLFNRETLDTQINKVLANDTQHELNTQCQNDRRNKEISHTFLGLIDIDFFKKINDDLGHLYGDEILVLVSRLMKENFTRETDLVFRYGGEEFVVLLNAANEEKAFVAFERLRKNISNYKFPQLNKVTVSIGYEEIIDQNSPYQIIAAADKALYFAKNTGRNRTKSYAVLTNKGLIAPEKVITNEKIVIF